MVNVIPDGISVPFLVLAPRPVLGRMLGATWIFCLSRTSGGGFGQPEFSAVCPATGFRNVALPTK